MDVHRFALLPAEISSLVWQFFMDSAAPNPRVLNFSIHIDKTDHHQRWKAIPGPFLDDRTRPATTALTVCKDTRYLALRSLPDTLAVKRGRRRGVVRFNKDRDIVAISTLRILDLVKNFQFDGFGVPLHDAYKHCIIPGLSDNIRNLAFKGMVTDDYLGIITQVERYPFMISLWHLLAMFRDVQNVFELVPRDHYAPHEVAWCAASEGLFVQEVDVHPYSRSKRLESVTTIWHDIETLHRAAGRTAYLQPKLLGQLARRYAELIPIINKGFPYWFDSVKAWPMIQFYCKTGHRALAEVRTTPADQLPMGLECCWGEMESCNTEADEDEWIHYGSEDEADFAPGDDASVCNHGLSVNMEFSLDSKQNWFRSGSQT